MAKSRTTKDTDKGNKKIREQVAKLAKGSFVTVGVHEAAGEHKNENGESSALTVADVATFHEFGTERVRSRSFIRASVEEKRDKYNKLLETLAPKVLAGSVSVEKSLALLGETMKADMQNRIRAGINPPLAESTLKRKTVAGKVGAVPLIDTGQLIQSITYEVKKK